MFGEWENSVNGVIMKLCKEIVGVLIVSRIKVMKVNKKR